MARKLWTPEQLETAFSDVKKAFKNKAPLSCAILGAAYVEKWLGAALRNALIPQEELAKKLFGTGGVLENCGAQNDIAFAIDLISKEAHDNIARINDIRNCFAHSHEHLRFEESGIAPKCGNLTFYISSSNEAEAFKLKYVKKPRMAFSLCVTLTGLYLNATAKWNKFGKYNLHMDSTIERLIKTTESEITGINAG